MKLQKTLAVLALFLGTAHIIYGLVVFKNYSVDIVWFIGAGIAMIVVAMTNLSPASSLKMRVIQNLIMTIYTLAILGVLIAPQVILACLLFGGLLAASIGQALSISRGRDSKTGP